MSHMITHRPVPTPLVTFEAVDAFNDVLTVRHAKTGGGLLVHISMSQDDPDPRVILHKEDVLALRDSLTEFLEQL